MCTYADEYVNQKKSNISRASLWPSRKVSLHRKFISNPDSMLDRLFLRKSIEKKVNEDNDTFAHERKNKHKPKVRP